MDDWLRYIAFCLVGLWLTLWLLRYVARRIAASYSKPYRLYKQAWEFVSTGNNVKAEALLTGATTEFPTFFRGHTLLARLYGASTRPKDAERLARHALTLEPNYAPAHYFLGCALEDLGHISEAVSEFRRGLECPKYLGFSHWLLYSANDQVHDGCRKRISELAAAHPRHGQNA